MATDRTVLVRLKADVGSFVAGMSTARAAVKGITSEIDTTNDRVAWLSQGILAIGPTLVPLGAAAVPIFTGIATQATVAAGAVGVMTLAFNGIGDTMKAVNEYQLKPTVENFDKMTQALDKFGPAGAEFVAYLDSLGPQLHQLQLLSREGIFPGAQEGIEELMTLLPRAKTLVSEFSGAIGDLMADAGGDIAGPRFEAFFDFLDRNARPILEDMARSVGNFASGFFNMLVGFEPLTNRFSKGMLEMSRSFRKWSEGLDENATFQDFIAYIDKSIPMALDFGSAVSEAFVAIVTAAAPVGDVMLPLLTNLLDIISALAETPLGPIFLTAAAAMSLYGRAVAIASVTTGGLLKGLVGSNSAIGTHVAAVKTMPAAYGAAAAAQAELSAAQGRFEKARSTYVTQLQSQNKMIAQGYTFLGDAGSDSNKRLMDSLGQVELANRDVENATDKATAAERQRAAAMRATVGAVARTAGVVGGLALVTSGYAEKVGLANSASFALMGAMVGGAPGAAIGGLIGVTMDLRAASGKAGEAQRQMAADMAAAGTDLAKWGDALGAADDRYQQHLEDLGKGNGLVENILKNGLDPDAVANAYDTIFGNETVADSLKQQRDSAFNDYTALNDVASKLAFSLGLATENQYGFAQVTDKEMATALTSVLPAMQSLGISVQDLIDASNEGTLGPLVEQLAGFQEYADSAAGRTDAVVNAVSELDSELDSTASSATALSQALDALLDPELNLSAATDAWVTSLRTLRDDLAKNNKTLVGNSKAAIQNREAIRDRVGAMKDVLKAEAEAGAGAGKLSSTLRRQRDALIDAGKAADLSKGELNDYLRELGLTPKLVRTLIDNNAPDARSKVNAYINELLRTPKQITTYIDVYRRTHGGSLQGQAHNPNLAAGGPVVGPGGPTDDKVPIWGSNGEYMVRAAAVAHYGMDFFNAVNAKRLAGGGPVSDDNSDARKRRDRGDHGSVLLDEAMAGLLNGVESITEGLKVFNRALSKAQKAVDADTAARDAVGAMMEALSASVQSQLRSDVFETPDIWSANAGMSTVDRLNTDTQQAELFAQLVESLSAKGLKGAALAEVAAGGVPRLKAYDTMSSTDLQAYATAYERREKALTVAGTTTGQAGYGAEFAMWSAKVDVGNQRLKEIEAAIHTLNREQKQAQKDNADAVGGHVKNEAVKGKRNKVYGRVGAGR